LKGRRWQSDTAYRSSVTSCETSVLQRIGKIIGLQKLIDSDVSCWCQGLGFVIGKAFIQLQTFNENRLIAKK